MPKRRPLTELIEKSGTAAVLVGLCLILSGCWAGTWQDDARNWRRAFGEERPVDGITIVHSWYMLSPHFTTEYAWFFELQLSDKMKQDLQASPVLKPLAPISDEQLRRRIYPQWPDWFKPEPLTGYDVFESTDMKDFIVLIEKNGARSFWTRMQL